MEKEKNIASLVLVIVVLVGIYFATNDNVEQERGVTLNFTGSDLSSATQITCSYPQVLNSNYLNGEISHNIPPAEKNPIIFTFSGLEEETVGQLSYIDSTQSITNVPILKLTDDAEKIIYLDGSGENYFSTHTIYKSLGVSTYTKTVSIFGIPSGTLAMGTCVPY